VYDSGKERRSPRVEGFSDGTRYDEGRPDYPAEAVSYFAERLALTPGRRVLDLAAGTGKLTRHLVALGLAVIAVEPSESMRSEFSRHLPNVSVIDGVAERIPLADATVDAVLVAQSFHWFDAEIALAEIARVLRDGGGLGLVWNERDESVEWVRRLSVAMRWHEFQPYEVGMDFCPVLAESGVFMDVTRRKCGMTQKLDRRHLLLRVESTSYIAAREPHDRRKLMEPVERLAAELPEPIDLPYTTDVYTCCRVPRRVVSGPTSAAAGAS
jgi:SAM-dependent methyltransferase